MAPGCASAHEEVTAPGRAHTLAHATSLAYHRPRSKTDPRNSRFGFVAKHRFHFIVGRPRTHVISSLDFGSRVYLRAQWELARSLAERRLLAERECLGRCARVGGHLHLHGDALQPRAPRYSAL